jgi:pimeloyl-ACP methyl ester carboxylesterase
LAAIDSMLSSTATLGCRTQPPCFPAVIGFVGRSIPALAAAVVVAALALLALEPPATGAVVRCAPKAGDVRFTAADGTRLAGHRFGRGDTAVVFAHMSRGSLCQWVPYAQRLARMGYLALPFDFRNYGDSQRRSFPASRRWAGDIAAAVKTVRQLGAKKVFVVGASLGGSACVQAAANVKPLVNGVVSLSGAADLSGAIEAAARLEVPALFVAGARDETYGEEARRLYDATPVQDKAVVVVDRAEHGTQLVTASAEVRRAIEAFLAAHR